MVTFDRLTHKQLRNVLRYVPQSFCPGNPAHRTKMELQWAIVRAHRAGRYIFDPQHAEDKG